MHDAGIVGSGQTFGELAADADASREIERLAAQSPQRGAVDVLHDDEPPAVGKLAERVDRADVRVIQR